MTTIFLVEDESYALRALQQKIIDLNEDYIIVGTADNGLTALEQIPPLCPDIVITDIRMPDASQKSGEELVESVVSYFKHNITSNITLQTLEHETGLSLREISETLGFTDVYYFSKVFKRITGRPPSKQREEIH